MPFSSNSNQQVLNSLLNSFFGLILFWFLLAFFVPKDSSPEITLTFTFICGLVALAYVLCMSKRDRMLNDKLILFALLVFTVRVSIGILHYCLAFGVDYFSELSPDFQYLTDYEWLHNSMSEIASNWAKHGFGSFPDNYFFEHKNVLLHPYLSLLYYLTGNNHYLNITVVNALHSALVAFLVSSLVLSDGHSKTLKAVFVVALFQPFGLFSSIMWRDSVGQFFLVCGSLLITQLLESRQKMFRIIFGSLFLSSLRNIYFVIGVITGLASALHNKKITTGKVIGSIVSASILLFVLSSLSVGMFSFYDFGSNDLAYRQDFIGLIKRFFIGFTGPFPWTQIFDPNIRGREYLLPEVLQAVFSMAVYYFICLAFVNRKMVLTDSCRLLLFLVFMVTIVGLLGYGHISYTTVSTILLLPLIPRLDVSQFFTVFSCILVFVFLAGVLWRPFLYA